VPFTPSSQEQIALILQLPGSAHGMILHISDNVVEFTADLAQLGMSSVGMPIPLALLLQAVVISTQN